MDDTENYLNSILQKRMGSVPNYAAFSKNGNTVTRLPKKQQKVQSMPTVFRKKHETVYKASEVFNSQNPIFKTSTSPEPAQQLASQNRQSSNQQRVQYMLISKRIEGKEESNFKAPTVDVSKYRQSTYIPPKSVPPQDLIAKNSQYKMPPRPQPSPVQFSKARSSQALEKRFSSEGNIAPISQEEHIQEESLVRHNFATEQSQGGRRRKIFGASSREKL